MKSGISRLFTIHVAVLFASLLAFDLAHAACQKEAPKSDNSVKLNDGSAPAPTVTADQAADYDSWIIASQNEFGQKIGENCNGRVLLATHVPISARPLDPAFAKALSLTYDRVILELQAQHVMQLYGEIAVKQVSDFFENDSTNKQQFEELNLAQLAAPNEPNKVEVLINKMVEKKDGGQLDQVLIKQGATEDKIKTLTIPQKKQLFKDNFQKTAFKSAVGTMSGLVPIRTKIFTTTTSAGDAVEVAVLAVVSEKTRQFADDLAHRRATNVKGAPRAIEEVLPSTKEGYLNEIGFRMVYDQDGRPMLVSYGRWGIVSKSDEPAQILRFMQAAKDSAQSQAESYIAGFMATAMMVSNKVDADQMSEDIATKVSTVEVSNAGSKVVSANEQVEKVREILDTQMKKVKAESKASLRGTAVQKTWDLADKNGIINVGSVVTWTYDKLENDESIVNSKSAQKPAAAAAPASPENKTSKNVNTPDDF